MTEKKIAKVIADALTGAANAIYGAIAPAEAEETPDAPVQGAEMAATGATAVAEVAAQPEVVAAAVEVGAAASEVEAKREKIDDAFDEEAEAQRDYEKRLAEALALLKKEGKI